MTTQSFETFVDAIKSRSPSVCYSNSRRGRALVGIQCSLAGSAIEIAMKDAGLIGVRGDHLKQHLLRNQPSRPDGSLAKLQSKCSVEHCISTVQCSETLSLTRTVHRAFTRQRRPAANTTQTRQLPCQLLLNRLNPPSRILPSDQPFQAYLQYDTRPHNKPSRSA